MFGRYNRMVCRPSIHAQCWQDSSWKSWEDIPRRGGTFLGVGCSRRCTQGMSLCEYLSGIGASLSWPAGSDLAIMMALQVNIDNRDIKNKEVFKNKFYNLKCKLAY